MSAFLYNLNRIFSISTNVALNILFRIIIVATICGIDDNYKQCGSHILVILGLLNLTYFFSIGSSLRVKACLYEKDNNILLLGTFLASLTLNILMGAIAGLFAYFAIHPILMFFNQPENVIEHTSYFFKSFSFCLLFNAMFQSFQQICIGFNLAYVVNIVNAISMIMANSFLVFSINHSNIKNYLDINFTYPFLVYGSFGSVALLLILKKRLSFPQMKNITLSYYVSQLKKLFRLSFPFCIQNIHGNLIYFSHILILGMTVPSLLVAYHIFMQSNLILFIIVLGGVQAYGLDSFYSILRRQKIELIKKMKEFAGTIILILIIIGIIYFMRIFNHIHSENYDLQTRYDLWISYGIAFTSVIIFLIRNGLISSLTNLGDQSVPAVIATSMSLGVGLPVSIFLVYFIKYPFVGIHLGIIIHYIITAAILFFRFRKKWGLGFENKEY